MQSYKFANGAPEYIAQHNQWWCLQFVTVANVMQVCYILWPYVR
jgi:hypothetical protein